jgi:hypothetical protein
MVSDIEPSNLGSLVDGTAYLYVIQKKAKECNNQKVKNIFLNIKNVVIKIVYCFNLPAKFKNTLLILKTNVFVDN